MCDWVELELGMGKMHTHRDDGAVFSVTSLPFCFVLPGSKFFLDLENFPDTHAKTIATLPTNRPRVDKPPVEHPNHATSLALPQRNVCVLFIL